MKTYRIVPINNGERFGIFAAENASASTPLPVETWMEVSYRSREEAKVAIAKFERRDDAGLATRIF